jgi:hypothetical protein
MAKKTPEVATDTSELNLSELLDAESLNPALEQIYAELGGEAHTRVTVYVYKAIAETGKEPQVWKGPPDDYDLMAIAKRFGSGDYRVKIYAPTERGNPAMKTNQVVPILLDPAEDARIEATRRGDAPLSTGAPAMTEARMAEMIAAAIAKNQPAAPTVDPMAMMQSVVGMVKQMLPAQAAPQSGGGFQEVLSAATSLLSLTRQLGGGNDDIPRKGEKVDLGGAFGLKGLALLEKMVEGHLSKGTAPVQQPANSAVNAETELTAEQLEELETLRFALKQAVKSAKAGEPAEQFAEMAYDHVSTEIIAGLYSDPKWFETIVANVPDAASYRPWFEKLRSELIRFAQEDKLLTADGQINDTLENGAPDAGNATGDTTGSTK